MIPGRNPDGAVRGRGDSDLDLGQLPGLPAQSPVLPARSEELVPAQGPGSKPRPGGGEERPSLLGGVAPNSRVRTV